MKDIMRKLSVDDIPTFIQDAYTIYIRYTLDKKYFKQNGFDYQLIENMPQLVNDCAKAAAKYEIYFSDRKRSSKVVAASFNETMAQTQQLLIHMRNVFSAHNIVAKVPAVRNNYNRTSFIQMLFTLSILGNEYSTLFDDTVNKKFHWAEQKGKELSKMLAEHENLTTTVSNYYTYRSQMLGQLSTYKKSIKKIALAIFHNDPYRRAIYSK